MKKSRASKEVTESESWKLNKINNIERFKRSLLNNINGEFDPGSERTLAAWIRHASRTLVAILEWRKGE